MTTTPDPPTERARSVAVQLEQENARLTADTQRAERRLSTARAWRSVAQADAERLRQQNAQHLATEAALRFLHYRREWDTFKDMQTFGQSVFPDQCNHCRTAWPCATASALQGAPEATPPTVVTTAQLSAMHAHIVERTGRGMDPSIVRAAAEAAGLTWDARASLGAPQ